MLRPKNPELSGALIKEEAEKHVLGSCRINHAIAIL